MIRVKVLVVDDDAENLDLWRRILRRYEVHAHLDPLKALAALAEHDYQLIISDQRMPSMPGIEFLEQATARAPLAERVLCSAHADFEVLRSAVNRAQIRHFLAKPIDPAEAAALVERLTRQPSPAPPRVVVWPPEALGTSDRALLAGQGYEVADEAPAAAGEEPGADPQVMLLGVTGASTDSLSTRLLEIGRRWPATVVIFLAPIDQLELVSQLASEGRFHDVLVMPARREELVLRVRCASQRYRLAAEADRWRGERIATVYRYGAMVGRSGAIRQLYALLDRVGPSDATVMITGETGTGKELVARMLHSLSSRRDRAFVAVNCAALSETLVESELFGHEKGAFTGATARRVGRFEAADGGTLFIDEVGDMPASTQVKLLRALQERTIERVGGSEPVKVNVRLIAATHRDLAEGVRRRVFREDLYYRLNVVPVHLPALRQRREDILLLAGHFLEELQRRLQKRDVRLSPAAARILEAHPWPGNVRQLQNVIERVVALVPAGGEVQPGDLGLEPREGSAEEPVLAGSLKQAVEKLEQSLIVQMLRRHGSQTRTARQLGITRQGLAQKMAKYGIQHRPPGTEPPAPGEDEGF